MQTVPMGNLEELPHTRSEGVARAHRGLREERVRRESPLRVRGSQKEKCLAKDVGVMLSTCIIKSASSSK
jgi:hypothetical protein